MVGANRVETNSPSPARRLAFKVHVSGGLRQIVTRPCYGCELRGDLRYRCFECLWHGFKRSVRTARMQVLLRRSEFRQDIRCSVCAQGFRLYWEQNSPSERATMRSIVLGELRDHHSREQGGDETSSAHPFDLFRLPSWTGSPKFSRKTLLAGPSRPPSDISKVVMISRPKQPSQR